MNPQMQAEEVISRDSENLLLKFPVLESLCGATVQTTFCVRRKSLRPTGRIVETRRFSAVSTVLFKHLNTHMPKVSEVQ